MSQCRYISIVITIISLVSVLNATAAGTAQVTIEQGLLEGSIDKGITSFKGIPYAQPPVGERRWLPPEPVKPQQGARLEPIAHKQSAPG